MLSAVTRPVGIKEVAEAAGVSPDDMMIIMYEIAGENVSVGQGEAQRVNAVPQA